METTDYKKLAENVEVISAILKKTSCDISEISNMFLWLGGVFMVGSFAHNRKLMLAACLLMLVQVFLALLPFSPHW